MRKAASLVVLARLVAAGCGGDGVHHLADAPPQIDASSPIDAAPSPVTLTVTNAGAPVPGVHVWFQQHDSTLVSSTMTDATGVASAIVEPGAFVTALDPFPQSVPTIAPANFDELRTFAGVKPGDHLVLDQPASAMSITFTMTAPIEPNSVTYSLNTTCGSADITPVGGSGSLPGGQVTLTGCANGAADMLIETFDANGGVQKFLFAANVPVSDAGTVDLSASTYAAPTDATFGYTNVPATISNLEVEQALAGTHGVVFTSFGGADVSTGAGSIALQVPAGVGTLAINDTVVRPTSFSRQEVVDWAPFAAAYTLDVGAALLPDFSEAPALDLASHTITWSEGTGGAPDFSLVQFDIDRDPIFWTWEIAAPYTAGAVTLPVLPADGAMFNAIATDAIDIFDTESAKVPGGYDAVRANVLSNLQPQAISFVAGATGRAVRVRFQQLKGALRHHRRAR